LPTLNHRLSAPGGIASVLEPSASSTPWPGGRPAGDRYQITSGHHRKLAALKKGLTHVWAWVEDLADDDALMELVLANNQGELTPLEIGLHVLRAVPLGKAGSGKKGGLSAYARKIGKTQQYISQIRDAAEVALACKSTTQVVDLLNKTKHLSELHAADESLWPVLVQSLLTFKKDDKDEWTVERAAKFAEQVDELAAHMGADMKWAVLSDYPPSAAKSTPASTFSSRAACSGRRRSRSPGPATEARLRHHDCAGRAPTAPPVAPRWAIR
jgi:hypothetical protein